jgi:hypothetical protein
MAYNDPLTTFDAFSAWMRTVGPVDEGVVTPLIPAASDLIARFCDRDNLGAVYTYTETYYPKPRRVSSFGVNRNFSILLKHYPAVSLSSVMLNGRAVTILSQTDLQTNTVGCYLKDDPEPRVLEFFGVLVLEPAILTVEYIAGYAQIPDGLQQACNQLVAEMYKEPSRVGVQSVAVAGETTAYKKATSWGMTDRVKGMCQPFKNELPPWGY